jgi:GT2 family glycosyltransferase
VRAPLVLFLNPDTELLDGALEEVVRCVRQRREVGAAGCKMLEPNGTVQELGLQWSMSPWTALLELLLVTERSRHYLRSLLPVADAHRSGYVNKLYGGFMLVRREALDQAGWFDERYFMYAEDADLSRTLATLRWKLYYCADAAIVHVGGGVTVGAPSTFSHLMKQESINKLIAKYQGSTAAVLHRAVVALGGTMRLIPATAGRLLSLTRADTTATARWRASCIKQQQVVLWAIGLRKASVPVSRSAKAA